MKLNLAEIEGLATPLMAVAEVLEEQGKQPFAESLREAAVVCVAYVQREKMVTEVALCEVSHIFLRPGQLYRFVAMPGCEACEAYAAPYN